MFGVDRVLSCENGKSVQRTSPKSHLPENDWRGVNGTEKVHIRMSEVHSGTQRHRHVNIMAEERLRDLGSPGSQG